MGRASVCSFNEEAVRLSGIRVGWYILGIISNFMNLQNVPGYHQNVVKGVIILLAVLLQTGFRGRAAGR